MTRAVGRCGVRETAPERMAGKKRPATTASVPDGEPSSPMSSYELFASVTYPVVGPHVDGTIFSTLCIDIDRHLFDVNVHFSRSGKEREGRNTSPSVRI